MFMMTVVFEGAPQPWVLLFRTQESFDFAKQTYSTPQLTDFNGLFLQITDDFGEHFLIERSKIHGVMFEDMEQSKLAYVEKVLHQTKMQMAADSAARADPMISSALNTMRRAGAPPVITPFNGTFRQ